VSSRCADAERQQHQPRHGQDARTPAEPVTTYQRSLAAEAWELDSGIRQLADNPEMGAECDYVREGYRVLFINSHAVYYAVTLMPRF
jgi:hypothetical protein